MVRTLKMNNWKKETACYLPRIERLLKELQPAIVWPPQIPHGPLNKPPLPLQSILYRAANYFTVGCWCRAKETTGAILDLWHNGYLSAVGSLARLLFELWAMSHYLRQTIEQFEKDSDFRKFFKVVNKIFEGVRSEVLLPYGVPASETPIHILDAIRTLRAVYPQAIETYNDLCESSHPNFPRYMEWWFIGKEGDNWSNPTVQKRGHALLCNTISAVERAVTGLREDVERGLKLCGKLYEEKSWDSTN